MRWAVYLASLTADEYDAYYPMGVAADRAYVGRPRICASHPSRYEPHIGAGSVEEYVMGVLKAQPVDLRQCRLVGGLAGYTNAAQLALSLLGFSRDHGSADGADHNALEEVMGLARAIPEELRISGDAWDALPPVMRGPKPPPLPSPRQTLTPGAPANRRQRVPSCSPGTRR
jgi:hypothetical protein